SDGSVAYVYEAYVSEANGYGGWQAVTGQSGLFSRDSAGQNQQGWQTKCEGTGSGGYAITDADILAVNPTNPSQIAYGNCVESDDGSGCFGIPSKTAYDVFGSGGSRSSASDDVLLHTAGDPTAVNCQDASTKIGDLDFSPDASHLVELHGGYAAGIYIYPASANGGASATELMAIPAGWTIYGVRYLGAGHVGFSAGPSSDKLAIYSMPTSCTPATCDVSTGAGVTDLTGAGNVNADYILNTSQFGYTSSNAPIAPLSTNGGNGGTNGGGNGGTNGGNSGNNGHHQTAGSAPKASVSRIGVEHLKVLLRKGLSFTISCSASCHLTASIMLKRSTLGKTTKRLKAHRRLKLTIHIAHRSRTKLRRPVKLTLKLVVSDTAGHRRTLTRKLEVKR
ncbi:MAG: hypothetical protein ACRDLV_09550, partial [Solirubrobacteraceae bacterium]